MNLGTWDATLNHYLGATGPTLSMLASPELAALSAWAGLSLLLLGLYITVGGSLVQKRLRRYVIVGGLMAPSGGADQRTDAPGMAEVLERRLARRRTIASLRMQLARAGLSISVTQFLGLRIVSGMVAGLLVGIGLAFSIGWLALAAGVVAALVGSLLPNAIVSIMIARRLEALEKQIPNALDMVASSLQAGTGLAQGFALLSRDMGPPISREFAQVLQEVNLGLSMTEALTNLANRVNSEEMDLVITSIIIQMRVGGNLVHVLRTAANTIRERLALKGEIRVLTAQQRFSAVVIGILPPGVAAILFLVSPQYMGGLFMPGITRFMLLAGLGLQLIGVLMLRKISEIDV